MKQYNICRIALMLLAPLFCHSTVKAQKLTEEKLLGCWKLTSIEFLKPTKDSQELINSAKNIVTCFEKNGKFTTKFKTGNSEEIVGTGSFSIAADGKTINQKRDADDGGIDDPAEVTIINDRELSFKVEGEVILHYVRLPVN
jgi:hypothetical protein